MELSPEEKQRIYEEEKARIEAREKIGQEKGNTHTQKGCLIAIIVLVSLIVIVVAISYLSSPITTPPKGVEQVMSFLENKYSPSSVEIMEWSKVIEMKNGGFAIRCKYRIKGRDGFKNDLFFMDANGNVTDHTDWDDYKSRRKSSQDR